MSTDAARPGTGTLRDEPVHVDIDVPEETFLNQLATTPVGSCEFLAIAPRHGGGSAVRPGTPLLLRWTSDRGIYSCLAVLVSVASPPVDAWRVRAVGAVEKMQRREYARAEFVAPVVVVPLAAGPVSVVKGELADLSEGGLRAHLTGRLAEGGAVEVHMVLESTPVTLFGRVLRSRPRADSDSFETVITFIVREAHAAHLRRVVLRQQAQARRERIQ